MNLPGFRGRIGKAIHRLFHKSVENLASDSLWGTMMAMHAITLLLLSGCLALHAQSGNIEKLAPYYPTPETIVMKMLQMGGLKAGEKMFDLGSGDGRIVITAAQKFHADATGVEMDKDLYKQSTDKIRKLGLEKTARIINGDLFKQNYSSADMLTVYLLPTSNSKVAPMLEGQLKKGTRIVS